MADNPSKRPVFQEILDRLDKETTRLDEAISITGATTNRIRVINAPPPEPCDSPVKTAEDIVDEINTRINRISFLTGRLEIIKETLTSLA